MDSSKENLSIQRWVVAIAILLFAVKVLAYFLTYSVSILTDAIESTVNVVAGFIGLYSLYLSAKPSDVNHPYGHGKAEFLSATVEGTLIFVAGIFIIVEAVSNLLHPQTIRQLDFGILLIAITAVINFILGYVCIRKGRMNHSPALIASGKHLYTDSYSTLGIISGLAILYFTGLGWLDSTIALLFAVIILYTGYRIVRSSIAGIMDEADEKLIAKLVKLADKQRRENWIDLHNLRVIKYGSKLHIDCHLTVPWYLNVHEAHLEIEELVWLIRKEFGDAVEFFVHSDGCLDFQCSLCFKTNCNVRQKIFEKRIAWSAENVVSNKKHRLIGEEGMRMKIKN
ncbi:MAG TPA: cation diffusion facilitator family transporter [Flavitalea sp.]|nr:cation diffusion facilitator family transporter [Flavitalea sp.]